MKLPPFKLERFFARYEFVAKYLLSSSDCESLSIGELLAFEPGAMAAFQQQWLGYTESQGSPELRQAITALYSQIDPYHILVHTGAEEAIFSFMNTVLEPGDHVIVHAPGYQSLIEVARAIDCYVSLWWTHAADHWALDLDWLEQNIRPNTRAIVVNCPHNPTGYQMSRATQTRLVEIARAHNIVIFSDEVYRFLEHDPADRLPAICDLYENGVSLGVLSKTYGLPGLRIGWLATRNAGLYQRLAAFKDYLTICNSAPSEFLATLALRHREAITARNLDLIRTNLDVLDAFFGYHESLFDWQRPKAGSIAFPALRREVEIEAFCGDLVEKSGILLVPGTCFDYPGRHFRVGFGRRNMPQAVARLDNFLIQTS